MKEIEYIVGVYHFFCPNPAEHNEANFFLLYLLDEKGMIDIEELRISLKKNLSLNSRLLIKYPRI